MPLTTSADITSCTNYETLLNQCYTREANKAKKKLLQAHMLLNLRNKLRRQGNTPPCYGAYNKKMIPAPIPMPTAPVVTNSYPYQPEFLSYPRALNDWHPAQPVPLIRPSPSKTFATHINPFDGTVVQPILTTSVPQTFVQDNGENVSNYINEYNYCSQLDGVTEVANVEDTYYMQEGTATGLEQTNFLDDENIKTKNIANAAAQSDPLEAYLTLPKKLFPTARMLRVDPNAIIDEICKMPNLQRHAPWLLDLEFGLPRNLTTRPLPIYNVKFNSIHCRNTPDAIHPTFEECSPDFKRALLFYYDSVVSAWYRGYVMMTSDRSVENFQSWLLLPMQALGMCWP